MIPKKALRECAVDIVTISRKQATRAMRKSEAFPGNRVKPGRRRIRGHHNVQRPAAAGPGVGRAVLADVTLMYGLAALFGGASERRALITIAGQARRLNDVGPLHSVNSGAFVPAPGRPRRIAGACWQAGVTPGMSW
jgi:hypothetical protein